MKRLSENEIRKSWLDFFKSKGHYEMPSASLIPNNDPSLLWINSGVATLKPYFSGLQKPICNRLTSSQKWIRTNDSENVGITSRHHTFFEMLGNFSIGDYFKKEAIAFAYEYLVKVLEMDVNKLYITVFEDDTDAYNYWLSHGIDKSHIFLGNRDRNFWDVGNGPCGPCTEIYYDRGEKYDPKHIGIELLAKDIENDRYVEIWNVVFSQFNNDGKNNYTELAQKNIETGCGLERMACVMQEVPTNYDSDFFVNIINKAQEYSTGMKYNSDAYFTNDAKQKWINRNYIVVVDHLKASSFAIADGGSPSGKDRGAVLRKLIRRAIVCAWFLKLKEGWLDAVIDAIIEANKEYYPYLIERKDDIKRVIAQENNLFQRTFTNGIKLFEKATQSQKKLSGADAFKLSDTYGFPYEVIVSMCKDNDIELDVEAYNKEMELHQEQSGTKANIKAMTSQNPNLVNFTLPSFFDYERLEIKQAKIISIFNEQLEPIDSASGKAWLVFDTTVFYATSGGQRHDDGYIVYNQQKFNIINVIKGPNGQHLHLVDSNGVIINVNDYAELVVDKHVRLATTRNHSCEHLLQKALQESISKAIYQQGASKNAEKVTFDFSYADKLTTDKIIKAEDKVNEYIATKAPVIIKEMTLEEAKKLGAKAYFEKVYSKLGNKLRVVIMDGVTAEICAGTHVQNLGDIQQYMITDFETKGAGFYRITGISGNFNINAFLKKQIGDIKAEVNKMVDDLKSKNINDKAFNEMVSKLSFDYDRHNYHLLKDQIIPVNEAYKELLKEYVRHSNVDESNNIKNEFNKDKPINFKVFNNADKKILMNALNMLAKENPDQAFVALKDNGSKVSYVVTSGDNCGYKANFIIDKINKLCEGFGGGNAGFAQGGTPHADKKNEVISYLETLA